MPMSPKLFIVSQKSNDIKNYNEAARGKRVRIACDQQSMKPNDKIWLLEHEYSNAERFWTLVPLRGGTAKAFDVPRPMACPNKEQVNPSNTFPNNWPQVWSISLCQYIPQILMTKRPDMALIIEYK